MADVAPAVGTPRDRHGWVDSMRVVLIAGVIVVHTATGYVTDIAGWHYDDERDVSTVWSVVIALPAVLGGVFGLGPLFVLAGWFSAMSIRRRGPAGFVRGRLLRLGVALLLFLALVNPLSDYLGNLWQEDFGFPSYLRDTELGVVWFVLALLLFSVGYALLCAVRPAPTDPAPTDPAPTDPAPGEPRAVTGRFLAVAGAVIAGYALCVWPLFPLTGQGLRNLRPGEWGQGGVLFALGVHARERGWNLFLPPRLRRALAVTTAVGMLGIMAVSFVMGSRGEEDLMVSGPHWSTAVFAPLYGFTSVAFTLWFVAAYRDRWPDAGPLTHWAGRASYAAYVGHPLWLTLTMMVFRPVPLPAVGKFVVVSIVAVPLCFLLGWLTTRLPGARRVF